MRRNHPYVPIAVLALLLAFASVACKTKSAWDRTLDERARWEVIAPDWAQGADHTVTLTTRLSGPPNSPLETLTVRVLLQDASGATIQEHWHVYDLTDVPRGGPKDYTLRIPADGPVEALAVDPLPNPGESERGHIRELSGLSP